MRKAAYLPRENQTHHTPLEMISAWSQVHVVLLFERRQVVALFVRSLLCVKLLDVVDEVVVGLTSDEPAREGGRVPDVPAVHELENRAFPLVDRPAKAETELATEFHLNSGLSSQRQLKVKYFVENVDYFCLNCTSAAEVLARIELRLRKYVARFFDHKVTH